METKTEIKIDPSVSKMLERRARAAGVSPSKVTCPIKAYKGVVADVKRMFACWMIEYDCASQMDAARFLGYKSASSIGRWVSDRDLWDGLIIRVDNLLRDMDEDVEVEAMTAKSPSEEAGTHEWYTPPKEGFKVQIGCTPGHEPPSNQSLEELASLKKSREGGVEFSRNQDALDAVEDLLLTLKNYLRVIDNTAASNSDTYRALARSIAEDLYYNLDYPLGITSDKRANLLRHYAYATTSGPVSRARIYLNAEGDYLEIDNSGVTVGAKSKKLTALVAAAKTKVREFMDYSAKRKLRNQTYNK